MGPPIGSAPKADAPPQLLFPGGPSLRDTKSARELLERLDAIFGGGFFERGELVITAVRDLQGVAKVAHKLQSRLLSAFGDVVEVKPEFIKEEEWRKPKFAQTTHEVQLEATSLEGGEGVGGCERSSLFCGTDFRALGEGSRICPEFFLRRRKLGGHWILRFARGRQRRARVARAHLAFHGYPLNSGQTS